MANLIYGTKEYKEHQLKVAEQTRMLISEGLAALLAQGKVKCEELIIYADVLADAESKIGYLQEEVNKFIKEETKNERE